MIEEQVDGEHVALICSPYEGGMSRRVALVNRDRLMKEV